MAVTRNNAIIYIDRQFFDYYEPHLATPLRFAFTSDSMLFIDIIAKDKLSSQIDSFILTNKLQPASIVVLLSDHLLFCKELTVTESSTNLNGDVQNFLDAVPFEHILNKTYRLEKNKELIVTTNQDLLDEFQKEFNKHGSRIDACIPFFLLGKTFNAQSGLNKVQAQLIIDKLGSIRQLSLPVFQEVTALPLETVNTINSDQDIIDTGNTVQEETTIPAEEQRKNRKKKQMYLLIVVFAVFIVILIYLYIETVTTNTKPATLQQQTQQPVSVLSTPTTAPAAALPLQSSPVTSAFSATDAEQKMNISIQYTSLVATTGARIYAVLNNVGFKNISLIQTGNTALVQNAILFKPSVPLGTQQRVVQLIQKVVPNVTSQVNGSVSSDIIVSLQK